MVRRASLGESCASSSSRALTRLRARAAQRHVRPCRRPSRPVFHRPLSDVHVARAQQEARTSRARRGGRGGRGSSASRPAAHYSLSTRIKTTLFLTYIISLPLSSTSSSSRRPTHLINVVVVESSSSVLLLPSRAFLALPFVLACTVDVRCGAVEYTPRSDSLDSRKLTERGRASEKMTFYNTEKRTKGSYTETSG